MRIVRIGLLTVLVAGAIWLALPTDLICRGQRISTTSQALQYGKGLILKPSIIAEAGTSSSEYLAAVQRDPQCCSADYGPRVHEGAGRGWRVRISALHLPNEYDHAVEFDQCGKVSYNGGISMKGALSPSSDAGASQP